MRKIAYPAIILVPDKDGDSHGVIFPDLPGCVSAGTGLENAFLMAGEALELHLHGMAEDGEELPPPSSLAAARVRFLEEYDGTEAEIAAVLLVPALLTGPAAGIDVALDSTLVSQIDAVSDNRAAFLAEAVRAELQRRRAAA